ncbi:MAG: phosphatidylglycerol lysyltransferase domain-containing protein [Oscillospiraceae bacterium]|jgi:hypothetical protein|nr:phosphatidylglycerol lysyltransferase domain-containing protein [Oscillospiraceae bacterium]
MLLFRPLEPADFPAVKPFFALTDSRLCDTTSVLFLWRKHFSTEFCLSNGSLFIKQTYGSPTFMTPIGGDYLAGIEAILATCRASGLRAIFSVVTEDELSVLRSRFTVLRADEMGGWADYLYESRDLIDLPGKRFHGQRNHISQFDRRYPNHLFEPLTDMAAARDFLDRFYARNPPDGELSIAEHSLIYELLEKYDLYGQVGGLLTVGGTAASLSVGEVVGDTLFVHIEKADTDYVGVYQKTVNLFARAYGGNTRFINREEDMGIEGLRRSKLSYHPTALLTKYMTELAL